MMRVLAFTACAVVAAAAIAAATAPVEAEGRCEGSCVRESQGGTPTALMQLKAKVQSGGRRSTQEPAESPLDRLGRTFLSVDPLASAKFLVRYYQAEMVTLPACASAERAAVRMPTQYASDTDLLPVIVFIKDESLPVGDLNLGGLIGSMNETLARAASGVDNSYVFHFDNHDGWRSGVGSIEKAIADGVPVAGFYHTPGDPDDYDALVQIPHTMQTIQMRYFSPQISPVFQGDCRGDGTSSDSGSDSELDSSSTESSADSITGYRPEEQRVWWKSTFAATNPDAAANLAVNVLGAHPSVSPYDSVTGPTCTTAVWLRMSGNFGLHFVKSPRFQNYEGEMQDFTQQVRSLRNLTAGKLDRFVYNSLMFKVDSIDPYVDRVKQLNLPFLVVSAGPEEQVLLLDVPENDFTIQIRSKHSSEASQMLPEWCALSLGDLSSR